MLSYKEYIKKWLLIINDIVKKIDFYYDISNNWKEWRIDSIINEEKFIQSIIKSWFKKNKENKDNIFYKKDDYILVVPTSARNWFDIALIYNDTFFPINIKISDWKSFDNLFGVKVLNYLLFGEYEKDKENYNMHILLNKDENKVAEKISNIYLEYQNFTKNKKYKEELNLNKIRDYFLVNINKTTNKITTFAFLNILEEDIRTNPKNGFQLNISKLEYINNITNDFNFEKNIDKLVRKYIEYTEKKAQPYLILTKNKQYAKYTKTDKRMK